MPLDRPIHDEIRHLKAAADHDDKIRLYERFIKIIGKSILEELQSYLAAECLYFYIVLE